jgi:hypothetical protein
MSEPLPSDFDWVTARAKCSAIDMFETLRQLVQVDVERRNAQYPEGSPKDRFKFKAPALGRSFTVYDAYYYDRRAADFTLEVETIRVQSVGGLGMAATIALTDNGECRLMVGAEELEPWQFLRRALEPLFFRPEANS